MAGEAFRLVIPQDMLNKLQTADEKLAQLGKTSQTTQSQVIASFKAMADGVNPFIQKLNEAQQALGNIKGGNINFGNVNTGNSIANIDKLIEAINQLSQKGQAKITINGIDATANQAVVAVDSINKLIDTLVKLQQMGGQKFTATTNLLGKETLKQMNSEARKMSKTIDKLDEATQRYASTAGTLSDKIRQAREAQRQFNEEAKRAAQTSIGDLMSGRGKATTLNELKAYANKLKSTMANLDPKSREWNNLNRILQETNKDIQRINESMGSVRRTQSNLMNHAQQLRRALALVFSVSQITGYINKMVQVRGEFELQQRSLQAILQNKDEADKLWQQTVDLAVRSPFRVKELVSYTKQLAAYRVETEKLHETTKMLSDVSAGLGVDAQRLILAYGQVKAANYLRGTELRQFSEAGINILGELAKYFTELEGRAVSVGEVFERVSKRMVAFSDVEEIFKRVTSEGGVFYRMQEIQSETVKGLISNLYDQVDLMLNDIGKSNDGVLKGAIILTRTLIENWKAVATVLKQVGAIIAAIQLSKFALGLKLAGRGFVALATNMGGATAMAAKLRVGLSSLLATMKAHPILLIVGAIASAVHALWEYNDAIDATNEKYNEMSKREIRRADALGELNEKVLENNKIIKDNNLNAEKQNEALKNNESILAKIKKEYPELYGAIVKQKDGTIDLTEAIKEQNKILERNIALQQQAKAGFFQESQEENYKEVVEAQADLSNALDKVKTAAITAQVEMKALGKDALSEETTQRLTALIDGVKKTKNLSEIKDAFKSVGLYLSGLSGAERVKAYNIFENIQENYAIANAKLVSLKNAQKDLLDNFKNQKETLFISLNEIETPEERGKWLEEQLTTLGILDEKVREWAKQEIPKLFPITLDIKYPSKQPLEKIATEWREQYNTFIKSFTTGVVDEIYDDTNTELYINNLKGRIESVNKDIEAWDAGNAKARAQYTKEQIELMRLENAERKKAYDWLVYNKKQAKKEESEELKNLKKQIQLVRQLADDYEEMWKKYGKAYADANIKSAARRNAFTEVGLDIDDLAVGTRQDEKNNLQKLLPKALGIEGGKIEIEKATADVEVEIAWDLQEDENANLSRELENMFGNYELSLELKKLNIPPDLANQLFGIDTIDLSSLRKEILNKVGLGDMANQTDTQIFDSTAYKNLNEHQQKELAKHLQKVEEMERKAQEERLKKYVAFSRKALSERAKIKLQELQTIEDIERTFAIKQEDSEEIKATKRAERARALAQAQKEANDAIQKLDWEDFKSSDTFNNIFDDLEHASDDVLKSVIQRLKDFKDQWKDMPFEQMRQVVDLLNKAEGALKESDNPFVEARRLKKEISNDGRTKDEAQLDVYNAERIKAVNEEILATYELFEKVANKQVAATSLSTEQLEEYVEWQNKSVDAQRMLIEAKKIEIATQDEIIQKGNKQQSNIKKLTNVYKEKQSAIDQINEMTQDLYRSFMDLAENGASLFGEELDGTAVIFADMGASMADTVLQTVSLYMNLKSVETGAYAAGTALNTAMGVVGWIVMGVQLLSQAIKAFVEAHDNNLQEQIEREAKSVKKLQKAYDDLSDSIEKVYRLADLNEYHKTLQSNLEEQIRAYEKMIALEEDKKKTDEDTVEGYRDEIATLQKQMKEENEKFLQEAGGLGGQDYYKDATQSFVDAWLDAFMETGNGLSALQEQFDEVFNNIIKRQIALKVAGGMLDPLFTAIDERAKSGGAFTKEELDETLKEAQALLPLLDESLRETIESLGLKDYVGKNAELGGLQAGIQSVSEATADVLASYMSSVRLYVADNNTKFTDLITRLFDSEGSSNPMLAELKVQTGFIQEIRNFLAGVVRGGHSMGGTGLKVFIS